MLPSPFAHFKPFPPCAICRAQHNAAIYLTGLAFDVAGSSAMSLLAGFALPWSLLGIICLAQRLSPISLQGRCPTPSRSWYSARSRSPRRSARR